MEPNIHEAHRRDRRRRRLPAILLLTLIVIVASAWVGLFGFLGTTSAMGTVQDLEDRFLCDIDGIDLTFPDVSQLSRVVTADGVELGKLSERNSQPTAIEDIPETIIQTILSAEDKSFYEHEGVDFLAIVRAALRSGGESGASTITQQVVKQNFLSTDRTIERKICEAQLATELERRFTKDQILEFYANSVFFGSNAYGIAAAAQEYFGKGLDELTVAEAATLVAPIRNPSYYHPRQNPANALAARNRTIDAMAENGYITAAAAAEAKQEPLGVQLHSESEQVAPQVMVAVNRALLDDQDPRYDPAFDTVLGATYTERKQAVFGCPAADSECSGGGGLTIETTVDLDWQREATRILRSWYRYGVGNAPTGALATVENGTGAIKVIATGVEYGTDIAAGERPYDIASEGARAAGSAFKPYTLAAALEYGDRDGRDVTLRSYWDRGRPAVIDCGFPCSDRGNVWVVDAGLSSPHQLTTLEQGTISSLNPVYARVIAAIGAEPVVEMAKRLGLRNSEIAPVYALTLGAAGVNPLDMATAYSTFANQGNYIEPYLIERITDAEGTVIYQREPKPEPVLSPQIAAAITQTLEQVVARGTGTAAKIGRPQAGKTGTATDNTDVWFVGYIPQYTTAVWVGHPDAAISMRDFVIYNDLEQREQSIRQAFGGSVAAPAWRQFMLYITDDLDVLDFPEAPEGTSAYYRVPGTRVPSNINLDSMSVEQITDLVFSAHLTLAVVEVPSVEEAGTLLSITPAPGTGMSQGGTVTLEVSSGVPQQIEAPDLVGLWAIDVDKALATFFEETAVELEWQRKDQETTDPATWGRVVGTSPAPGALVKPGDTISVFVGVQPTEP
jgi:penicillin-binding protein 1A